jgi:hypothetical protein
LKRELFEVGTISNDRVYILQFDSPESKSANLLPAVGQIVHSLQIFPIGSESNLTSPVNSSLSVQSNQAVNQKPRMVVSIQAGSDPVSRGQEQTISGRVVDSVSSAAIPGAKVQAVLVDVSEAKDVIKNSNSSKLLQVSKIEGQKFSIVTDSNGQFSFSGKIKKSFNSSISISSGL